LWCGGTIPQHLGYTARYAGDGSVSDWQTITSIEAPPPSGAA
jgi:hypothetical protein